MTRNSKMISLTVTKRIFNYQCFNNHFNPKNVYLYNITYVQEKQIAQQLKLMFKK